MELKSFEQMKNAIPPRIFERINQKALQVYPIAREIIDEEPDAMVHMMDTNEYEREAFMQGMMTEYLLFTGVTDEQTEEDMRLQFESLLKERTSGLTDKQYQELSTELANFVCGMINAVYEGASNWEQDYRDLLRQVEAQKKETKY